MSRGASFLIIIVAIIAGIQTSLAGSVAYKKPLSVDISAVGINRISLGSKIATAIWGDSAEYSAALSSNSRELFLTSKLEVGKTINIALQLANGRMVDLALNVVDSKMPKIIELGLGGKISSSQDLEIKQLLDNMRSGIKGKYYVFDSKIKIASFKQLEFKQGKQYRFGNLVGVVLEIKNLSKKSKAINAALISKAFKDVVAVQVERVILAKGATTQAFVVLNKVRG